MPGNIREREVSRLSAAIHEAMSSGIFNGGHQPKTMYLMRRLVVLPDATLDDRCLVELPVVGTQLADNPVMPVGRSTWITTDATGVYHMFLRKPCLGTGMLGDVAVRLMTRNDITEQFFQLNEYRLTHDAHYGSILQGSATSCGLRQFDFSPVVPCMTFRAQGDEVVRCITTSLPTLDVVNMQLIVPGLALAALSFVSIPEQHVFPYIRETELFPFLVVGTLRRRKTLFPGLQQLGIELCSLDRYLPDWQELAYPRNPVDMAIYLLSYGWCNPPRIL